MLFLVYINDHLDAVNSCIKHFADDTKLFGRESSSVVEFDELETDQQSIMNSSDEWEMAFN